MRRAIAVDVGQTGIRALFPDRTFRESRPGVRPLTDADAIVDLADRLSALLGELTSREDLGVGLTGFPTDPVLQTLLAEQVLASTGAGSLTIATDIVTSLLGAIGSSPGAVVIWGTGAVALASDGGDRWHRVDGRGHLLGDHGSGSWIGQAGLRAALDHREGRAEATELAARAERFGDRDRLYRSVHSAPSPAGFLAAFAPDVIEAAASDEVALAIVEAAADELARTIVAAGTGAGLDRHHPLELGVTGGVARSAAMVARLERALAGRWAADVRLRVTDDAPMTGSRLLAEDPSVPERFPGLARRTEVGTP